MSRSHLWPFSKYPLTACQAQGRQGFLCHQVPAALSGHNPRCVSGSMAQRQPPFSLLSPSPHTFPCPMQTHLSTHVPWPQHPARASGQARFSPTPCALPSFFFSKPFRLHPFFLKLLLFADDMMLHIKNPNSVTRKLLELINEFRKVPGYKINTRKSLAFLYTNNEIPE